MLLLATDTSGKFGSIALADCGPGEECRVLEVVPLEGGTFSAQLVPQIAALLAKHGFTKGDIGAFAVVSGPGSFTGLRVGLSAIKALAEILHKPIVTVSLLEAVATSDGQPGSVAALLDAGRSEVYAGEYEVGEPTIMRSESLISREGMASLSGRFITPDSAIADFLRNSGRQVQQVDRPSSAAIARLGWQKLRRGETVTPEALEANYLRRSDAEIFSKSSS